ncbi:MAG: hypothetical protein ABSH05_10175 [Bryobacteraceae bacterium]|jgi:hypothetical protein
MTLEHLETLIAFAVVMLGVSLLITVFTQMISALLGLRGTNLLWGLKTLFANFDQRLVDQAEVVLRRPLISDSIFSKLKDVPVIGKLIGRWTLASALRPDELARSLSHISADLRAQGNVTTAQVIDDALAELDPDVQRQVKLLAGAVTVAAPGTAVQAGEIAQKLAEKALNSMGKLEALFNTAMGRVAARFALHMRLWTVLFAGLIAFAVHLDSFKLLVQLWSNPQMRASLVNSQDAMMKEAASVVALPPGSAQASAAGVEPLAYTAALDALKTKEPAATKDLGDVSPAFASLDAAVNWIQPKLIGDENAKKTLTAEYSRLVSVELMDRANKIRSQLESSGFQLIPSPYPGFPPKGKKHIFGILVSWALLSLGSPFWFNALKSLSSLRPILAAAQPPKDQNQGATA